MACTCWCCSAVGLPCVAGFLLTFAVAQVDLSPVASDEGASSLRSAIRVSACVHSPPRNTTCKLHRNDADRRASSGADHGPVLSLVSYIAVARSSSEADARAAAVLRDQHYEFIRAAGDQGASAGAAAGAAGRVYDLYAHVPPGHIGRRVCSPGPRWPLLCQDATSCRLHLRSRAVAALARPPPVSLHVAHTEAVSRAGRPRPARSGRRRCALPRHVAVAARFVRCVALRLAPQRWCCRGCVGGTLGESERKMLPDGLCRVVARALCWVSLTLARGAD